MLTSLAIRRLGLLSKCDQAISKAESIGSVASRLAMASGFKFRILSSLLEEICKSRIEIAQRLLKNNRTALGEKGFLRLPFPFGQFQGGIVIANGFVLLLPCLIAMVQSLIVNKASATEGPGKLRGLRSSREEPEFKRLLNYH